MKVCPQCNTEYPDDYVFCLTDGNTLTDESGEQETLFRNKIVFPEKTSALSPDLLVECVACGLANRANSKFCKKCGSSLAAVDVSQGPIPPAPNQAFGFGLMPENQRFQNPQKTYDETRAFQSPVFAPPTTSGQRPAANNNQKQTKILIAAVVAGVILVVGAVIYSSQPDSKKAGSNSVSSNLNKPGTSTPTAGRNNAATVTNSSSSVVGRKGHLTTNQRIRSDSNRYAEILGVHYQAAKVEILDEKTYSTEDGSATWYRVRVLENGCDRGGAMGCGNDLNGMSGQAAMEGWMNAKYLSLD
jgi:hypothetical protein